MTFDKTQMKANDNSIIKLQGLSRVTNALLTNLRKQLIIISN